MTSTPESITEAELAGALAELGRLISGNAYFPDLARNIFGYVERQRCEPETDSALPVPDDTGRGLATALVSARDRTGAFSPDATTTMEAPPVAAALLDREALGQMVRTVWVACALGLPDPKPSNIAPWEEISEWDREVDRRIGEAVAAHAATVVSLEMCRAFGRDIGAVQVERDGARAKLLEYENAITWGTSCLSCSRTLDRAYAETERAERAEADRDGALAKLAAIRAACASIPSPVADRILAIAGTGEGEDRG